MNLLKALSPEGIAEGKRLAPLPYNPKWHEGHEPHTFEFYNSLNHSEFSKDIHNLQKIYLMTFYGVRKFKRMLRKYRKDLNRGGYVKYPFSTRFDIVKSYKLASHQLRKRTLPAFRNYLYYVSKSLSTIGMTPQNKVINNSNKCYGYWFYRVLIRKHKNDPTKLNDVGKATNYLKSVAKSLRNSNNGLITLFDSIEDEIISPIPVSLNVHLHALVMTNGELDLGKEYHQLNSNLSHGYYLTLQPYYDTYNFSILRMTSHNSQYCFKRLVPFVKYLNKQTSKLPIVKTKDQYQTMKTLATNSKVFTRMARTIYSANGGDRGRLNHYHLRFNQRAKMIKRNEKRRIAKNSIELELIAIRRGQECSELLHAGELPGHVPFIASQPVSVGRHGMVPSKGDALPNVSPFVDTPAPVGTGVTRPTVTFEKVVATGTTGHDGNKKSSLILTDWFKNRHGKT